MINKKIIVIVLSILFLANICYGYYSLNTKEIKILNGLLERIQYKLYKLPESKQNLFEEKIIMKILEYKNTLKKIKKPSNKIIDALDYLNLKIKTKEYIEKEFPTENIESIKYEDNSFGLGTNGFLSGNDNLIISNINFAGSSWINLNSSNYLLSDDNVNFSEKDFLNILNLSKNNGLFTIANINLSKSDKECKNIIEFVTNNVNKYKDKIDARQIGYNIDGFFKPCNGIDNYSNVIKNIYKTIKNYDNNSLVILNIGNYKNNSIILKGKGESKNDLFIKPLLKELSQNNNFDVIGFEIDIFEEKIIDNVFKEIINMLKKYNLSNKQLRITKTLIKNNIKALESESAFSIIKLHSFAYANGINKIILSELSDLPINNTGTIINGIIGRQGSSPYKKTGFYTYKLLIEKIKDIVKSEIIMVGGPYLIKIKDKEKNIWIGRNNKGKETIDITDINTQEVIMYNGIPTNNKGYYIKEYAENLFEYKIIKPIDGKIKIEINEKPFIIIENKIF